MVLVHGHRLATDFSILVYKKGDAKLRTSSKRRGSTGSGVSRILRYWKEVRVILSTDRGLVVLRFSKRAVELRGFIEVTFLLMERFFGLYGSMVLWFLSAVRFSSVEARS